MKTTGSTATMKVYDLGPASQIPDVIPEKVVPVLRVHGAGCFMGGEFSR